MLTLFAIPDASTVVSSSTAYSTTWFTEFLPVVYLVVGMAILALGVPWLIRTLKGALAKSFGKGRRGGMRRRR